MLTSSYGPCQKPLHFSRQSWYFPLHEEQHIVIVPSLASWVYNGDDRPIFCDLNCCSSFFNLLFSLLKLSQHFFKNSQSTSVCFSLVLHVIILLSLLGVVLSLTIEKKLKTQKKPTDKKTKISWNLMYKLSYTLLSCSETKLQLVLASNSIARQVNSFEPACTLWIFHQATGYINKLNNKR